MGFTRLQTFIFIKDQMGFGGGKVEDDWGSALPEPVAPPAAGWRIYQTVAAWTEGRTSSAFWCRLLVQRHLLHQSPGGRTWRSGPPRGERREEEKFD